MNRFLLPVLAVLLAVQLLVTAAVYRPTGNDSTGSVLPLLNDGVAARADGLRISDDGGAAARLIRTDDGWALAASGLPAAPGRVVTLLSTLEAEPGWPVARSEAARERFAVAEDTFERRVELLDGDMVLATVLLGTAPGFRQVHARAADSEAIYSIGFNAYDAPADDSGWLDRGLAAIPGPTAVRWDGHRLEREDDRWRLNGVTVEGSTADELLRALTGLQVTAVAEAPQDLSGARSLAVDSAGQAVDLTLVAGEELRFLKSSAWAPWFTVSRYDYDRIVDSLEALTGSGAEADSEPGESIDKADLGAATP